MGDRGYMRGTLALRWLEMENLPAPGTCGTGPIPRFIPGIVVDVSGSRRSRSSGMYRIWHSLRIMLAILSFV